MARRRCARPPAASTHRHQPPRQPTARVRVRRLQLGRGLCPAEPHLPTDADTRLPHPRHAAAAAPRLCCSSDRPNRCGESCRRRRRHRRRRRRRRRHRRHCRHCSPRAHRPRRSASAPGLRPTSDCAHTPRLRLTTTPRERSLPPLHRYAHGGRARPGTSAASPPSTRPAACAVSAASTFAATATASPAPSPHSYSAAAAAAAASRWLRLPRSLRPQLEWRAARLGQHALAADALLEGGRRGRARSDHEPAQRRGAPTPPLVAPLPLTPHSHKPQTHSACIFHTQSAPFAPTTSVLRPFVLSRDSTCLPPSHRRRQHRSDSPRVSRHTRPRRATQPCRRAPHARARAAE